MEAVSVWILHGNWQKLDPLCVAKQKQKIPHQSLCLNVGIFPQGKLGLWPLLCQYIFAWGRPFTSFSFIGRKSTFNLFCTYSSSRNRLSKIPLWFSFVANLWNIAIFWDWMQNYCDKMPYLSMGAFCLNSHISIHHRLLASFTVFLPPPSIFSPASTWLIPNGVKYHFLFPHPQSRKNRKNIWDI